MRSARPDVEEARATNLQSEFRRWVLGTRGVRPVRGGRRRAWGWPRRLCFGRSHPPVGQASEQRPCSTGYVVGATGFEPVTPSVSANTANRCARSRSPRSPPTVDVEGKRSLGVQGNALFQHLRRRSPAITPRRPAAAVGRCRRRREVPACLLPPAAQVRTRPDPGRSLRAGQPVAQAQDLALYLEHRGPCSSVMSESWPTQSEESLPYQVPRPALSA